MFIRVCRTPIRLVRGEYAAEQAGDHVPVAQLADDRRSAEQDRQVEEHRHREEPQRKHDQHRLDRLARYSQSTIHVFDQPPQLNSGAAWHRLGSVCPTRHGVDETSALPTPESMKRGRSWIAGFDPEPFLVRVSPNRCSVWSGR
jgi:hypothetical protein